MALKPELLRGIYAYGFERPSAIQQRAIMPVIKGEFFLTNRKMNVILIKFTQDTMLSPKLNLVLVKPRHSPSQPFKRLTPASKPAKL